MCRRGRDDIDKPLSGTVIVILYYIIHNNIRPELKVTLNIVVVRPPNEIYFYKVGTLFFFQFIFYTCNIVRADAKKKLVDNKMNQRYSF